MTAPKNNPNPSQFNTESLTLHCGNNAEVLKSYPDCHFDAIVTDPPYGIEFLGKDWDSHTGTVETWRECLRVLKPGGHLLAFSAARTYHHLATNIESTGFEIRDQLMWIYSSGFPKAQDMGKALDKRAGKMDPNYGSKKTLSQGNEIVSDFATGARCGKCNRTFNADIIKDCEQDPCGMKYQHQTPQGQRWAGWKTALKPAHEPIVMARKPFKGSTIDNIQQHGVGALNIDVTRIPFEDAADLTEFQSGFQHANLQKTGGPTFQGSDVKPAHEPIVMARKPMRGSTIDNVIQHGVGALNIDATRIGNEIVKTVIKRNEENSLWYGKRADDQSVPKKIEEKNNMGRYPSNVMGHIPNYQKYFYCPKVSRRERHVGFDATTAGNNHPTVKPVALMRYLIQLVTPVNSIVLDPFMGSGSTGMAAVELGHTFVGIDLDPAYVEIAGKRIKGWCRSEPTTPNPKKTVEPTELWDDLFE